MRRAALLTAAIAVAGILAAGVTALADSRRDAFTLGVPATWTGLVKLRQGGEVCQAPIAVPKGGDFDAVRFALGTEGHPGPQLEVLVREARGGAVIGRGGLAAGYPDSAVTPNHTVAVGHVPAGRTIAVCLANKGSKRVFVYGNAGAASRSSEAMADGRVLPLDMDLVFVRSEPRSLLALMPDVLHRAALFRAGWVGTWTYFLLAALVLLAVPALLARAVGAATRSSTSASRSPSAGQP
jgi:hypothetical protein